MTEAEWLDCHDPFKLFAHLGRPTWRKRQLFALAVWRSVRDLWQKDEYCRKGMAFLEANAASFDWSDEEWEGHYDAEDAFVDIDGELVNRFWNRLVAGDEELWDAVRTGTEARLTNWDDPDCPRAGAAFTVVAEALHGGWVYSLYEVRPEVRAAQLAARIEAHANTAGVSPLAAWWIPMFAYADLVREVFGNPIRPRRPDPAWLHPTVLSLAGAAYEERSMPAGELDPARLAVLSDALEEAGCTDEAILSHLRSPGPHVRGCWAVDLVLGKE
jgi:hypothetical protein